MNHTIPEQTLMHSGENSPFGISPQIFQFLEHLQNFKPTLINKGDTVQPVQSAQPLPHDIPEAWREFIISVITGIVETQIQRSPLYEIVLLSCEETAAKLGVATDTVRDYIKSGKLPAAKVGNGWRIRLTDIDRMLKELANFVPMPDQRYQKKFKSKFS